MSLNNEVLKKVYRRVAESNFGALPAYEKDFQMMKAVKDDYMRLVKAVVRDNLAMEVAESALSTIITSDDTQSKDVQAVNEERRMMLSSTIKGKRQSSSTHMQKLIITKRMYNELLNIFKLNHGSHIREEDLIAIEIEEDLDVDNMDNSSTLLRKG